MGEITISDRAFKRIEEIRAEKNVPNEAFLKVGVVSGGCSGLTYDLDFATDAQSASITTAPAVHCSVCHDSRSK